MHSGSQKRARTLAARAPHCARTSPRRRKRENRRGAARRRWTAVVPPPIGHARARVRPARVGGPPRRNLGGRTAEAGAIVAPERGALEASRQLLSTQWTSSHPLPDPRPCTPSILLKSRPSHPHTPRMPRDSDAARGTHGTYPRTLLAVDGWGLCHTGPPHRVFGDHIGAARAQGLTMP